MLARLVDRSLVVAYRPERDVRYRLLETIRDYARDLLGSGLAAAQHAHLNYYLGFAKRVGDGFLGATTTWYQRLRADFANLRAAFEWSVEKDMVAARSSASALVARDRVPRTLTRMTPSRRPDEVDGKILARGLVAAGSVAGLETRSHEAVELLTEALELLQPPAAEQEAVWCEMWLGAFYTDLGRYREGVQHAAHGLALARACSPVAVVYLANQHAENAAAACVLQPSPDDGLAAARSYALAIEIAAAHRVEEGLLRAQHGLAFLHAPTDPEGSLTTCRDALQRWRSLGEGNRLIIGLVCTARVALLAGERGEAGELLLEALDDIERVGWRQPFGRLLETAAVIAAEGGDASAAATLLAGAHTRFLTPRWHVPLPLHALGAESSPVRDQVTAGRASEDLRDDELATVARAVARDAAGRPS